MICGYCHMEFEYHRKRKYCSLECCLSANAKPNTKSLKKCRYEHCSKEFVGSANKLFCSDNCRTYHSHGDTTVPGWRERRRIINAPRSSIWVIKCPKTGILFTSRTQIGYHPSAWTISSTGKSKYIYEPIPPVIMECTDCGKSFESRNKPRKRRPLCRTCGIKEDGRIDKGRRRAAERGNTACYVSPYEVFTRDKWTCQMCHAPTPKKLRGTIEPNAPELDHIIPIAKGGAHSYENTQCLCRACNNAKGDRIIKNKTKAIHYKQTMLFNIV